MPQALPDQCEKQSHWQIEANTWNLKAVGYAPMVNHHNSPSHAGQWVSAYVYEGQYERGVCDIIGDVVVYSGTRISWAPLGGAKGFHGAQVKCTMPVWGVSTSLRNGCTFLRCAMAETTLLSTEDKNIPEIWIIYDAQITTHVNVQSLSICTYIHQ